MWSAGERDAALMELCLEAKSRSRRGSLKSYPFTPPQLEQIANDCVDLHKSQSLLRTYHHGDVVTYLRDIHVIGTGSNRFLVMLLAISDKRRPDDVLSNPIKGHRRDIPKAKAEGNEYSCHIVIRLKPTMSGGVRYRLGFELVPLFNSFYVARFLRFFFRELSKVNEYSRPHPSGKQNDGHDQQVPISLSAELHAVPSDELLRDLNRGEMGEIELSRDVNGLQGWDQGKYTVQKRSILVLQPSAKTTGQKILDAVHSVCSSGYREKFSIAKLRWKNGEGQSKSAQFDCETASLLTQRYVKRHTFTLATPLPASCLSIDTAFSGSLMGWVK